MIVRMILEGVFTLGRRPVVPTLRIPGPRRRGQREAPNGGRAFRGRPDLMLLTGAMSAPSALPGRPYRLRQSGARRWAA